MKSISDANQYRFYFAEIDSLRFISFLLVFLGHTFLEIGSSFVQTAWFGVEFFFFLSGFLLTRVLCFEYEANGFINKKYYFIRRLLRIWPLYFVFLSILLFLYTHIFNIDFSYIRLLGNIFFIDNFLTVAEYSNSIPYCGHLWTISVEEQYYLILPFLLLWLFSKSQTHVKLFFIIIFLLLFIGKFIAIVLKAKFQVIHLTPLSADSFLTGVLLGFFYKARFLTLKNYYLLLFTGFAFLFIVVLLPSKNITGFHQLIIYPLQATGFALILISILGNNGSGLNKILKNRILSFLGKISFGLYIFHIPVVGYFLKFFTHKSGPIQLIGLLLMFLVTVGIASVSYYFFEKRFLSFKKNFQFVR
ncbi:acyltransferase [Lacibacter luteus]|uniref:Acyltransferase n=1 Tax=Lacibacter luteus TaxID=2508719 RepID=A0A4Q1CJA6_9BACT|nr:acyltransferase [Lacibacter luteus]RXK60372.1 acyltransferase [Lacibacter luteus]